MHVERIQILSSEFELRTNSCELFDRVCYLTAHAQQAFSISHRCVISVTWSGEEFRISNDDGSEDYEMSAAIVIEQLFKRMHRMALANLPDHVCLRAVTGNEAEKAFLIVGPKDSGKTTLAVSLLHAGFDISGDQLTVLLDGKAVAFPRRFIVNGDCVELLSKLSSCEEFAAFASNPERETVIHIDPTRLERPWRLVPRHVSAVFFLEPNYGTRTTVEPCGKLEMLKRIMPHCMPSTSKRTNWIGDLSRTIDNSKTYILRIGELDSAVLAMKERLQTTATTVNRAAV
jgi:GTPase SAR1 family protein